MNTFFYGRTSRHSEITKFFNSLPSIIQTSCFHVAGFQHNTICTFEVVCLHEIQTCCLEFKGLLHIHDLFFLTMTNVCTDPTIITTISRTSFAVPLNLYLNPFKPSRGLPNLFLCSFVISRNHQSNILQAIYVGL